MAAQASGALNFRAPGGWSTKTAPLFSVQGPAVVALVLVRKLDVRALPPGTAQYVDHGRSLDEVLRLQQYRLVRLF